jgi:hypothetical protein
LALCESGTATPESNGRAAFLLQQQLAFERKFLRSQPHFAIKGGAQHVLVRARHAVNPFQPGGAPFRLVLAGIVVGVAPIRHIQAQLESIGHPLLELGAAFTTLPAIVVLEGEPLSHLQQTFRRGAGFVVVDKSPPAGSGTGRSNNQVI